jgi:CHAT domain-containing protein
MHSLPYYAAIDGSTGRYAIEDYVLGFAPSLGALANIWQTRTDVMEHVIGRPLRRIMGVAYPGTPEDPDFLPNAEPETKAMLACFPQAYQTTLLGVQATPGAVIANASGQDLIHFSCHGTFNAQFPAHSGLKLSSGWLTVGRIIAELKLEGVRMVALSACLTARPELRPGDETFGLTQALLAAGANSVIASLWPVSDAATRALLVAFYRRVRDGLSFIEAMREAALDICNYNQWKHPYYWSPFIVIGLGDLRLEE